MAVEIWLDPIWLCYENLQERNMPKSTLPAGLTVRTYKVSVSALVSCLACDLAYVVRSWFGLLEVEAAHQTCNLVRQTGGFFNSS